MLIDAHCHPFDMAEFFPKLIDDSIQTEILAAASSCRKEEFLFNEELKKKFMNSMNEVKVKILLCYAIHPQMVKMNTEQFTSNNESHEKLILMENPEYMENFEFMKDIEYMEKLASENRLAAIGECGFDLYNEALREKEDIQDRIFQSHLEIVLRYDLPVILHVRRAMNKIFSVSKILSKCKAVIFHSWPGSLDEANSLLKRGVNAFFSFGNTITLNHKQAMRCCALLPAERLLTETDAPYQPAKGQRYSQWSDLPIILKAASALRHEAESSESNIEELENKIENNFTGIFGKL